MERYREQVLQAIRADLIAMGALVNTQIEAACRSLFEGDSEAAHRVIVQDAEVDAFDTRIEEACMESIALGQPVAVDLRLLMASLAINSQLERIGDIAVDIAGQTDALIPHLRFLVEGKIPEMARIARVMVEDGFGSFIRGDAVLAQRVLDWDVVVDKLDRDQFSLLVDEMKNHNHLVEPAARMLGISRQIERLADHATNIAEEVIFIVEAKLVKHSLRE